MLIDKWFVSNPFLKKKFNRMTIKISYSTTRNMKSFIVSHNSKILKQNVEQNDLPCNCTRSVCPLPDRTPPNNCRQNDVIYQGTITNNDDGEVKTYIGSTSDPLKARVSNHRTTFRDENKKNYSEMAKEIHRIKGFTRKKL